MMIRIIVEWTGNRCTTKKWGKRKTLKRSSSSSEDSVKRERVEGIIHSENVVEMIEWNAAIMEQNIMLLCCEKASERRTKMPKYELCFICWSIKEGKRRRSKQENNRKTKGEPQSNTLKFPWNSHSAIIMFICVK